MNMVVNIEDVVVDAEIIMLMIDEEVIIWRCGQDLAGWWCRQRFQFNNFVGQGFRT